MQKIIPFLWFDKEAKEAAEFYTALFPDSEIKDVETIKDTPSGDTEKVSFEISGFSFLAISAGPYFKNNPSVSFFVNFDPSRMENARQSLDSIWEKLADKGEVLMPLGEYPFSRRYGWIRDKYGFSWQLILTNPENEEKPFIVPSLLFTEDVYGRTEEAIDFYTSVFENSKRGMTALFEEGQEPDTPGKIMYADFKISDQWFAAMESARVHGYSFNEAVSFLVNCDSQEEIDYYWEKLSADPKAERCGWLKDKFGLSWQIYPIILEKMMKEGTSEQRSQVTNAFLKMKKMNVADLEAAYGRQETDQE